MNYKELSDKAYQLHSQNNLLEAEKLYSRLLEISPEDVNILNLYGLLCISKQDYEKAVSLLSRAVVLKDSAYIISNLAKAYISNGQPRNAIKLLNQALEKSQDDDIYYSLAIAYKKNNNINKAIESYKKALELNPVNYNAAYNLALLYKEKNEINNAIDISLKCLKIKQNSEEIYSLLSSLYEENNDINNSINYLEKASELNPKEFIYFFNLGVLYSKIDDTYNSIKNYLKALEFNPRSIETLVNLCIIYKKSDKETALKYILRAKEISSNERNVVLNLAQLYKDMNRNDDSIQLLIDFLNKNPNSHEAYSLLAINYMDKGIYDEALKLYNKAIELSPDNLNYLHGRAAALKYSGKKEEAKSIFEYICKKIPDSTNAAVSLGMLYLEEKNFKKGMPLYSKRSLDTTFSKIFNNKVWSGEENIRDKTILVYSDCGLGDSIMFSRYLNILKNYSKNIIFQTDIELVEIFKNSFHGINIVPKSVEITDFDIVIPSMSLPLMLNIDFTDIPYPDGYLSDDKSLTEKYNKSSIFNTNLKKIGVCFQGNKNIFKNRAIPVEIVNKIFNTDKFSFYSFQKEDEHIINSNVKILANYMITYNNTASLLKNIDLLITIDSSIAHMAGALNVKTFLLLPQTSEWRWFNSKDYTPWYNSIKIFKQNCANDWESVIDRVIIELNKL
mgnify:CR=1 FL=1